MQYIIDLTLHEKVFYTLQNAQRIAIDIGGSLAKLAYLVNVPRKKVLYSPDGKESYDIEEFGTQLHFIKFETKCIEACLDFIQKHITSLPEFQKCKVLKATGGGAYKYIDLIKDKLNFKIEREDEMDCLVKGCNFLLKNIPEEAFYYHKLGNPEYEFQNVNDTDIYPYLLVNIGSGVSILKVESEIKYSRIGGTSMGGGTFWGLGSLLTQAKGFDELLSLAEKGDHRNVDMLVKDIYGGDYNAHNLPANLIASSFGKTVRRSSVWYPPPNEEFKGCQPIYYGSQDGKANTSFTNDHKNVVSNGPSTCIGCKCDLNEPQHVDKIHFEDVTVNRVKSTQRYHPEDSTENISPHDNVSNSSKERQYIEQNDEHYELNLTHGPCKNCSPGVPKNIEESEEKISDKSTKSTRTGMRKNSFSEKSFREEDIAHSLLITISNDIGQIAYLNAKYHGLKRIYFGGFFIRGHPITMHTITYAMQFWSKGEVRPLFLRHEGYLGVVGAFLKGLEQNEESCAYSWCENYVGNSQIPNPVVMKNDLQNLERPTHCTTKMDFLMFERFEGKLCRFKLLSDPDNYMPDLEDLTRDPVGRKYWMDLFENTLDRYVDQARTSQASAPDIEERVRKFRELYSSRLKYLSQNIYAYGHLSVRILLNTCIQCLTQCGFNDPYLQEKNRENEIAIGELPRYYAQNIIGSCPKNLDPNSREGIVTPSAQLILMRGILAGNLFDWGSRDILPMLLDNKVLTFDTALQKIPERPWLIDDFDLWCKTLASKHYKCAAFFVDNSGADFILGILCLVDRFLALGTNVILCANSKPAFNDVTFPELKIIMEKVANILPFIAKSLASPGNNLNVNTSECDKPILKLLLVETGSGSPCLDFMRINEDMNIMVEREGVDLLVIEGMGRCVHTNLDASFTCDTIKLAVLKDDWFARRLGGKIFSPIFKFTPYSKPPPSIFL